MKVFRFCDNTERAKHPKTTNHQHRTSHMYYKFEKGFEVMQKIKIMQFEQDLYEL